MRNEAENPVAINDFLAGKRDLVLPFELTLADKTFYCEQLLRLLPAKRLVLKAQRHDQQCVVKLFTKAHKGQRELKRELQGHQLAKQAGIAVADIVLVMDDRADFCAIVYQFIADSSPFQLDNSSAMDLALIRYMAMMHQCGIYQQDIHLDNLLVTTQQIVLIDLATVKAPTPGQPLDKNISLTNLALLFAQFDLSDQQRLMQSLSVYFQARDWSYSATEERAFAQRLQRSWHKRKKDYLNKCFRNCTMTVYKKNWRYEYAFKREFWARWQPVNVLDIEALLSNASVLKAGNTATVMQATVAGQQIVIKRYNIKSLAHWIAHCWRSSRARISWRNANLLELIGLATPKPIGFIELRWGWLRRTAYFISEYQPAQELLDVYQQRLPTVQEKQQIAQIFSQLQHAWLGHGDMKAQNLLINEQGHIMLIDLDAMQAFHSHKKAMQAAQKDKRRFLKNWSDPQLRQQLNQVIENANPL